MNVSDVINSGVSVSFTITANDLLEVINNVVIATRKELEKSILEEKTEAYLTIDEVAEMIGVSKVTLWRWDKRGYMSPIEVGGKRKYLKSDVTALLSKNTK